MKIEVNLFLLVLIEEDGTLLVILPLTETVQTLAY